MLPYSPQQHELLLVGARGDLPTPAPADRPASLIWSRREAHSQKPEVVYELIESMYLTLPKLEMFSRSARAG